MSAVITCEDLDPPIEGSRLARETSPELAIEWAQLAYDIAYAEDQFLTFKGQRAIALTHLAMHDALQAIVPIYEPYAYHAARAERGSDRCRVA